MRMFGAVLALLMSCAAVMAQTAPTLPPVSGPIEPKVVPKRSDDGMFHQAWAVTSFLDLREDAVNAQSDLMLRFNF